jgi:outer membrane lipoprotein-sorting protein
MKKFGLSIMVGALASCGMGLMVQAGDSLESITKQIKERLGEVKSLSAKSTTIWGMGAGAEFTLKETGTFEMLRKGDKVLIRIEEQGTQTTRSTSSAYEMNENTRSTTISDGEYTYSLQAINGRMTASRKKADSRLYDITQAFSSLREIYKFEILPEEKLEGTDCWVIEAKSPREGKRFYIAKDTGLAVRKVQFGESFTCTTVLSNIKVNSAIPERRFVFYAPPGVEVREE